MAVSSLTVFLVSATLFVALALFVRVEQRRGGRLILGSLRDGLDVAVVAIYKWLGDQLSHFTKYVVQLGWYYSLHSFLRTIMRVLVAVYDFLETHFEKNLHRTRHLRAEKKQKADGHLAAMAEHKAETALTPAEEAALRHKKLEEKH